MNVNKNFQSNFDSIVRTFNSMESMQIDSSLDKDNIFQPAAQTYISNLGFKGSAYYRKQDLKKVNQTAYEKLMRLSQICLNCESLDNLISCERILENLNTSFTNAKLGLDTLNNSQDVALSNCINQLKNGITKELEKIGKIIALKKSLFDSSQNGAADITNQANNKVDDSTLEFDRNIAKLINIFDSMENMELTHYLDDITCIFQPASNRAMYDYSEYYKGHPDARKKDLEKIDRLSRDILAEFSKICFESNEDTLLALENKLNNIKISFLKTSKILEEFKQYDGEPESLSNLSINFYNNITENLDISKQIINLKKKIIENKKLEQERLQKSQIIKNQTNEQYQKLERHVSTFFSLPQNVNNPLNNSVGIHTMLLKFTKMQPEAFNEALKKLESIKGFEDDLIKYIENTLKEIQGNYPKSAKEINDNYLLLKTKKGVTESMMRQIIPELANYGQLINKEKELSGAIKKIRLPVVTSNLHIADNLIGIYNEFSYYNTEKVTKVGTENKTIFDNPDKKPDMTQDLCVAINVNEKVKELADDILKECKGDIEKALSKAETNSNPYVKALLLIYQAKKILLQNEVAKFKGYNTLNRTLKEFYDTELTFADNLLFLLQNHTWSIGKKEISGTIFEALQHFNVISSSNKEILESGLLDLIKSANVVCSKLEAIEKDSLMSVNDKIGNMFKVFGSELFITHLEKISNYILRKKITDDITQESNKSAVFNTLNNNFREHAKNYFLNDILIMPTQRLQRYGILIDSLIKNGEGVLNTEAISFLSEVRKQIGYITLSTNDMNL